MEQETVTNFHELKHVGTPDNVNSLALLDLNSLTDDTWTFSGNNQTASQMCHNESWTSFLISFNVSRAEGSKICLSSV